ncbi:MAG TPA: hypothetical protein VK034_19525 [Enhygromyxa sp.]|nr:hypothetical protein [Enhygromyxa sp.]
MSIASATSSFAWPKQPRCRIVGHGQPRLQVAVDGPLPAEIREQIGRIGVALVEAERADVDVRLRAVEDGRWVVTDELFGLASDGVPELPRFTDASIVAVLGHCIDWRAPLRLARRCTELAGALGLRLLDETTPSSNPQDPRGPDLAGTGWPRYRIEFGRKFCVEVSNDARVPLQVTLLNVAADGQVQLLADSTTIPAGRSHAFWMGELGNPFSLEAPSGFERVVAIGTTRRDQSFHHLVVEQGFAQAIAGNKKNFERFERPEQWTATLVTIESVPSRVE